MMILVILEANVLDPPSGVARGSKACWGSADEGPWVQVRLLEEEGAGALAGFEVPWTSSALFGVTESLQGPIFGLLVVALTW